ncbi:class I SAM-dependent methyltransferase [Cohnella sp. CFH 77786]|uniref:class I SAM-dependent methyltransferase n=1 Tax=Cohnella sp. CFH 77786 TaxID=2662265 RepID=UPI001C60BB95|nr:class I SAM-dependent methyltransferase [Cohnella sp. CFH 77786]MBW5444644.1 class I SAM-dependent methyltransferase [Cohnella sp. CFH 77786]
MTEHLFPISQLYQFIDSVYGWLTTAEQTALLHLPALVDHLDGEIVEIGSYKGRSTVALGLGSKWISEKKRTIYAIDPFVSNGYYVDYWNEFQNNILRFWLANYVTPIKKFSEEALQDCPARISALYIDGDQSYSGVKRDIELYAPRVVRGGYIAFHDYTIYPDIRRAVDELCESREFVLVCDYESLRLLRRCQKGNDHVIG